jgi:hypothetical protein
VTKDDGSRWILKETGGAPGRGGGRAARHRPMNVVLEGATEGCARDGVGGRLHDDELRRWGRGRGCRVNGERHKATASFWSRRQRSGQAQRLSVEARKRSWRAGTGVTPDFP